MTESVMDKLRNVFVSETFSASECREILAVLARAVPEGCVVVPREPTQEMVQAGANTIEDNGGNARWSDIREAWDVMIDAALKGPT